MCVDWHIEYMHRHAKCCITYIHICLVTLHFWKMSGWMRERLKKKTTMDDYIFDTRGKNHKIQSPDPMKHDLWFCRCLFFLSQPSKFYFILFFFHSTPSIHFGFTLPVFLSIIHFLSNLFALYLGLYHTINQFEYFLVCHFSLFGISLYSPRRFAFKKKKKINSL